MNALVASVIRTYTPVIVGQVVGFLIMINFPVRPELTLLLMAVVGGGLTLAYYTLVRILEQQWPAFGALLGLTKTPDTYTKGNASPETAAVPANPALGAVISSVPFVPAETVTVEPQTLPAPQTAPVAPAEVVPEVIPPVAPAETPAPATPVAAPPIA